MDQQIHPNIVRQAILLIVLALLVFLVGSQLLFLLAPGLGAIVGYVLLRNLMLKLIVNYKWKKWAAALVLILASLVFIILPIVWLCNLAYHKLMPIIQQPETAVANIESIFNYVNQKFQLHTSSAALVEKLKNIALPILQKILSGTLQTVSVLGLTYLLLYFMLYQTIDVEKWLRTKLPFRDKNKQLIISKLRNLVYSNAAAVPVVAIIQGVIAGISYVIFGAPEWLLFGVLTIFASFIPLVGCMLIYMPLGLYMMSQNHTWQGVAIILWGLIIVGGSDNVIRFFVQKKMAKVHPLVTILGVIMGLNMFGFLGIIFGPILLSVVALLVEVYINEFGYIDADDVSHPFDKHIQ